ncbi:MAG: hypothetical protein ACKO3V_15155 [Pirellula sp.]
MRIRETLDRSDVLNAIENVGFQLAFVLDVSTVSRQYHLADGVYPGLPHQWFTPPA